MKVLPESDGKSTHITDLPQKAKVINVVAGKAKPMPKVGIAIRNMITKAKLLQKIDM